MTDAVWTSLRTQVNAIAEAEPMMASYLHATVLNHGRLEDALSMDQDIEAADSDK